MMNRLPHGPLTILALAMSACSVTGLPRVNTEGIEENRQHKAESVTPPLGAVCRFQIIRKRAWMFWGGNFSSGAHIGGGVILTAGHNLHSSTLSVVEDVSAECGVATHKDGAGHVDHFTRGSIAVVSGYDWEDFQRDTAIIRVANPPAAAFEVAADDLQIRKGDEVHLSGFPGKGYTRNGEFLFSTAGKVVEVDPKFIVYAIRTTTGNSGGPVWIEKDGRFIVVGVHVSGAGNIGTARRVSQSIVKSLSDSLSATH